MGFFFTLLLLVVLLGFTWRYLGSYMEAVFDGRVHFLGFVERPIYRLLGTSPEQEQTWKRYASALMVFSFVSLVFTYAIIRLQGSLPLNPQHLGGVGSALSFNTASSFVTNTNWQNYGGETTMSYFSQMGALTVQQFVSPAVGIAVAIAMVRGFSRRKSPTIGNFWVDITRCMFYILLPVAFAFGIIFVGEGAVQTLAGTASIHDVLNGVTQTIARGPIGFMEAIKQLGTNGGGFLNANSATPFENPTGLTNFLSIYLLLSIPVALTYTFGKMVKSVRHGAALLAVVILLFGVWVGFTSYGEHQNNPAVAAAGIHSTVGNTEGKETRFGDTSSALFGVASTQTSTGSADAAYDSFTPLGGLGLLTGMMMGEVTPGGTGSGLYTLLIYAIIAVFIGGLMIGRTPEYLGKKIQAKEIKLAGLGALVMPIAVTGAHRDRGVACGGHVEDRERGTARLHRDSVRVDLAGQQQRVGLRRSRRQHALLQHRGGDRHVDRPLWHHHPRPRPRRVAGGQGHRARVARYLPHQQRHVRRTHHRCDLDYRWTHLLPRGIPRPRGRAT